MSVMSTRIPAALAAEAQATVSAVRPTRGEWIETALTVTFATVAVLIVSFFAVVTNL
jgi:hypothetical protein